MRMSEGFPLFSLTFDEDGALQSPDELDELIERAKASPAATDVVFLAHGFRNDVGDATTLYDEFLKTFRSHFTRPELDELTARRFVVAGVYWPSKPFKEAYTGATTRGLKDKSRMMADVKKQLQDFKKHDANAAQRSKLDKAIRLLPKAGGTSQSAG